MSKKIFNTSKAPRMSDVFPQAVVANNLIFLSGLSSASAACAFIQSVALLKYLMLSNTLKSAELK